MENEQPISIAYACPKCELTVRQSIADDCSSLVCPHCKAAVEVPDDSITKGEVSRCLVCPSTDLYIRKDFPQRLGVALVGIGIVGSSIAWAYTNVMWTFGFLFGTALIDLLLYRLVGNALMCYRCSAQYRGVSDMESHGQFNLETHERYRQMDARLNSGTEQGAESGT